MYAIFPYLSLGDPLVDKSSFACPLLELEGSTGASPRSTLDGIGGGGPDGGGFLPGMGGWTLDEGIR